VKREEGPKHRPWIKILFVNPSEQKKQHHSFQQRFVKLRRMPRHISTFRKYHRPGHICWTAEQFSIDEIAEAAKTESDRRCRGDQIGDIQEIPAFLPCDVPRRQNHSHETTMERHAALPNRENR